MWIFRIASGHSEQVTHMKGGIDPDPMTMFIGSDGWLGDPLRYSWSPDSTQIVFPSRMTDDRTANQPTSPSKVSRPSRKSPWSPLVLTADTPPQWTLAGVFRGGGFGVPRKWVDGKVDHTPASTSLNKTADHLFIVNVHSKAVRRLTSDDAGYFTPDWSPDGREVLCVSNEGRELVGWGSGPTNLYTIEVATGSKRALTTDSVYKRIPSWSPDGESISYLGANADNLGRVYLFVVARTGGKPTNLTTKLDRRVREAHWLPDSRSMAILYWDGVDSPIARLDVGTGNSTNLTGRDSAARGSFSVSTSGTVAWSQSDGSSPARIYTLRDHSAHVVVDLAPEIENLELGAQEVVRWKNSGGDDREGILIRPPGYQEGRRYPLIVDAYPNLQNGFKASPMMPGQAWASRGYLVFYPDAEGPHVWQNPWKSIADNTKAKGAPGVALAVDDVISGTDNLVRQGIADPERICIYGFSNGGGIVNQVVTKTNRFKCAISVAAAISADWTIPFLLFTQPKAVSDLAGATPWSSPQTYVALAAIYRIDQVTTPMLLANGDDDGGALLGEVEMYSGLRYLGRNVTFLRYPHQGHGFEGEAMKDFWERENAFLDKYLSPAPDFSVGNAGAMRPILEGGIRRVKQEANSSR